MRYLILFLALFAGCPGDWQPDIEVDNNQLKPNQLKVESIVEDTFGHKIEPTVYWTTTLCPGSESTRTAVVYKDQCYAGLTFSCSQIYVADRGKVSSGAFVHELGHCVRLDMGLDGDARHEDDEWWGTIEEIELKVREDGL